MDLSLISKANSPKAKMIYHEDPSALHIGTLPPHSYFIPFSDKQNPFEKRENSERIEFLCGEWGFRYFESVVDLEDNFTEIKADKTITVPSNWQYFGFDKAQYTNIAYPITYDPPYVPDDIPVGIYSRNYSYTPSGDDKILTFEGADSCLYLYVNGNFVGYTQVSHATAEFDITPFLTSGDNLITAAVLKWCDGTYLEDQDKIRLSGIFREVYVLSRPKKRITDYHIETDILSDGNADLKLTLFGNEAEITLKDPSGATVLSKRISENKEFSASIPAPQLWSAEKPTLYRLTIKSNGEIIGENVGFRKVEITDGIFKINGKHIVINGVNRHDSYADTGYYAAEAKMRADLEQMKRCNVNAVRTSHYPSSPLFYKLCDEYGLYVIDEADFETHGCVNVYNDFKWSWEGGYNGIALIAKDERFKTAICDRANLLVTRDRNRPSVIFWSLGNESGYGENVLEAARLIKSVDKTRPIHYESTHRLDETPTDILDVVSVMYPSIEGMDDYLKNSDETRPMILCEYSHAMGNSSGDLEDYHNEFYKSERFCGGLIWEWCDHVFPLGKTENGETKYGYGGDFGELHNDGNFCCDGLLFPSRKPHTGLLEAKQVFRPIRVEKTDKSGVFTVRNLMSFTRAEDYLNMRYEITDSGKLVASGEVDLAAAPSETVNVKIPAAENVSGDSVYIKFSFTAKEKTPWCDKGCEICFDQLMLSETLSSPAFTEAKEAVKFTAEPLKYILNAGGRQFVFDRRKAQICSIKRNETELLEKPIEFNFFRAPTDNDSMRGDWYRAYLNCGTNKVYETNIERDGKNVRITARHSFGRSIQEPFATAETSYTVFAGGELEIKSKVEIGKKIEFLPRLGLRLFLPKNFEAVTYYGYGPTESYIDKHRASYLGLFSGKIDDMHEDYIKPQENSSHYGCRNAMLSDGKTTLSVEAEKPFSMNASRYTEEELSEKKHNWELQKSPYSVLCIDSEMMGVGSASCGPQLAEKYRIHLPTVELDFILKID